MKGDIINNAVGSYNSCCLATGDIFNNAVDATTSCVQNLPYSDADMKIRRDNVSITAQKKAQVLVERNRAYEDWHDCKKKVFCNAKPKERRLDEWEQKKNASEAAAKAAADELAMAEKANTEAQAIYDKCVEQQTKLIELQKTAENDLIQKENAQTGEEVSLSEAVSATDTKFKYGAIIAGGLVAVLIGYIILK